MQGEGRRRIERTLCSCTDAALHTLQTFHALWTPGEAAVSAAEGEGKRRAAAMTPSDREAPRARETTGARSGALEGRSVPVLPSSACPIASHQTPCMEELWRWLVKPRRMLQATSGGRGVRARAPSPSPRCNISTRQLLLAWAGLWGAVGSTSLGCRPPRTSD